ncbi:MAG: MBG domain-containing protein, partial [Victivallales bacterium]
GGLVGKQDNAAGIIKNSFWNTNTSGQSNGVGSGSIGTIVVSGKSDSEMKQMQLFSDAGWDIVNTGGSNAVWRIYEGDTAPLLRGLLTPLTLTAQDVVKTYDGIAYSGGNVSGSTLYDPTKIHNFSNINYGGSAQGAVNAGEYVLVMNNHNSCYSDQRGYDLIFQDGSLVINKALLTVAANDDAKTYDGIAYAGGNGVIFDGFVNGESSSVLGGALAYGGTSQGAVNPDNYIISPNGLTADNYELNYIDGRLVINNPPPTVPTVSTIPTIPTVPVITVDPNGGGIVDNDDVKIPPKPYIGGPFNNSLPIDGLTDYSLPVADPVGPVGLGYSEEDYFDDLDYSIADKDEDVQERKKKKTKKGNVLVKTVASGIRLPANQWKNIY